MSDLDELLRTDGDAWRAPDVPPPDLHTALKRASRRRARVAFATALVALVAVATSAILINRPATPVPAVPDPWATPSASAPTRSPDPSPTPSDAGPSDPATARPPFEGEPTLQDLAEVARDNAVQMGIPAKVEAVRTTWLQAQEFLPAAGTGTPGNTEVWLVQVQGEFSCGPCTPPPEEWPEPGVSVLTLVLDAQDLHRYLLDMGDVTRPLANLGKVIELDPEADA